MKAADRDTDDAGRARTAALRAGRTAALARRGAVAREARPHHAYLVCAAGDERFGLPLGETARVIEMRPCTPVPGTGPAILGLVAVSGRIVTVVDLAGALGRPVGDRAGGHLVVLRMPGTPVALAVDRVLGLAHLPEAVEGAGGGFGSDAVSRYAPADYGPSGLGDFVVIDLPRLLRHTLP